MSPWNLALCLGYTRPSSHIFWLTETRQYVPLPLFVMYVGVWFIRNFCPWMWSAIEFMCDKETIQFGNSIVIGDVWFIWGKINIFYSDVEYLGLWLANQVSAWLNSHVQKEFTLNYSIVFPGAVLLHSDKISYSHCLKVGDRHNLEFIHLKRKPVMLWT